MSILIAVAIICCVIVGGPFLIMLLPLDQATRKARRLKKYLKANAGVPLDLLFAGLNGQSAIGLSAKTQQLFIAAYQGEAILHWKVGFDQLLSAAVFEDGQSIQIAKRQHEPANSSDRIRAITPMQAMIGGSPTKLHSPGEINSMFLRLLLCLPELSTIDFAIIPMKCPRTSIAYTSASKAACKWMSALQDAISIADAKFAPQRASSSPQSLSV